MEVFFENIKSHFTRPNKEFQRIDRTKDIYNLYLSRIKYKYEGNGTMWDPFTSQNIPKSALHIPISFSLKWNRLPKESKVYEG